jgi:hypothetical protein
LQGRIDTDGGKKAAIGHMSIWQLFRNKNFLVMAMVCAGASATGTALSIWQPQILKGFGLSNLETGFLNSVPYGIASVLMVLWGRHSDRTGERRWHTALALLLIACGLGALSITTGLLVPTVMLLSCALIGAYSFKGPFWALSSTWMSPRAAAAGLAGINAIANLVGGGAISLVGVIKESTGSFALALLPLVLLTFAGALSVLWMTRQSHPGTAELPASTCRSRPRGLHGHAGAVPSHQCAIGLGRCQSSRRTRRFLPRGTGVRWRGEPLRHGYSVRPHLPNRCGRPVGSQRLPAREAGAGPAVPTGVGAGVRDALRGGGVFSSARRRPRCRRSLGRRDTPKAKSMDSEKRSIGLWVSKLEYLRHRTHCRALIGSHPQHLETSK